MIFKSVLFFIFLLVFRSCCGQDCSSDGINCISCTEYQNCKGGLPQGRVISCKTGGSCADDQLKQCQMKLNCYAQNECTQAGIFPNVMVDSNYYVCLNDPNSGFLKYEFTCPEGNYFDKASFTCVARDMTLATSEVPGSSTSADPTSTSSDPASTSANPTSTSSGPTSTSSDPTSTSSGPTSTSSDPTSTSSDPTSTSANPTSTSSDPTSTSADPTSTSSEPTSTSTGPTSTSSEPTSTSSEPTSTSTGPTSTSTAPTSISTDPTSTSTAPTSTSTAPTSISTDPTSISTDPTSTSTNPTPSTPTETTSSTPVSTTPTTPTTPSTTSPTSAPFVCMASGIFPNPDNCKMYYQCSTSLKAFFYICPGNSYFNEIILKCSMIISPACQEQILKNSTSPLPPTTPSTTVTTPSTTSSTTTTTTTTTPSTTTTITTPSTTTTTITTAPVTTTTASTTTSPPTTSFSCPMAGIFANPLSCKTYYRCALSGKIFEYVCPGNTYFNEYTKSCSLTITPRCRSLIQG